MEKIKDLSQSNFFVALLIIGDIWVKDSKLSFDQFWHDVHFHGPKLQVLFLCTKQWQGRERMFV